jgi:hypothetical protein
MKLVIKLKIKGCKWKKDLRIKKRKKLIGTTNYYSQKKKKTGILIALLY